MKTTIDLGYIVVFKYECNRVFEVLVFARNQCNSLVRDSYLLAFLFLFNNMASSGHVIKEKQKGKKVTVSH